MLATKQRKNERFTSRHKIETLRRDGETLLSQSEHILEAMDKLGNILKFGSVFSLFRKILQGNIGQLHARVRVK